MTNQHTNSQGNKILEQKSSDWDIRQKLRQVVAGNANANAWLYDTFAAPLYRRLRQRYSHMAGPDVEDLLHDAFLFFFRNLAKLLRTFLERPEREWTEAALERRLWDLACGLATNQRRASALRKHIPISEYRDVASNTDIEKNTLDRDTLTRLDACIQARSPRIYLYYKLRHRDGLAPEEIVRVTGWSQKATYKLKQALNEAVRICARSLRISTD